jgi:23S rRNA (adenine2503-C2)-methyltransferase
VGEISTFFIYDKINKFYNIIIIVQGFSYPHDNYIVYLALSLHYADDELRKKFMPVANKFSISDLIKATDYYLEKTKRRVSFEYVVIDGVNNRKEDVDELTRLLKGKNVHINLIALNPIEEFRYKRTKNNAIEDFKSKLESKGLNATIRKSMGSDIDASCGQLRNNYAR